MVLSMTGFGRGEASSRGVVATVELRSVNSRFLEVSARLPRSLSLRENEIKEIIRRRLSRGKVNCLVTIERETNGAIPVRVNLASAKAYYALLNQLRKSLRIREAVKLQHLLQFSDIFEVTELEDNDEGEWSVTERALQQALDGMSTMRVNEGRELERDFRARVASLETSLVQVERLTAEQIPVERARLRERITQLLNGTPVDDGRLEMEVALLVDRLDVTEECVRFRSHNKFFLEALDGGEPAGRKLNFLVQEMNREVNTIGSKSSATSIAHLVVGMKEELEKIREQLQNIE